LWRAALFETPLHEITFTREALFLIIANGVFAFGLSKWFWLEGIHRVGVTKAISYNTAAPALTLIFAFFLFRQVPTAEQIMGLTAVLIGVPLIHLPHQTPTLFPEKPSPEIRSAEQLGFPTLNIALESGILKPAGVFAVHVEIHGKTYSGVLHAGPRPTLNKEEYRTEVHLFDFDEETVAGEKIHGEIVRKIRNVCSFKNTEDLKRQIEKDVKKAKRII
jgi:multidrug transporter EmrE-like cation transporter